MMIEKMIENQQKIKTNDSDALLKLDLLKNYRSLCLMEPVRQLSFTDEERIFKSIPLITIKQMIYVANVDEEALSCSNQYVDQLIEYANQQNSSVIKICALIESELLALLKKTGVLSELKITESGLISSILF